VAQGLWTPCGESHPAVVHTEMTRIPEELLLFPVVTFRYFTICTQIIKASMAISPVSSANNDQDMKNASEKRKMMKKMEEFRNEYARNKVNYDDLRLVEENESSHEAKTALGSDSFHLAKDPQSNDVLKKGYLLRKVTKPKGKGYFF